MSATRRLAGAACMAGYLLVDAPASYTPIPVMVVAGTEDETSEYEPGYWPGALANLDGWRERNGCTDEPREVWRDGAHHMVESSVFVTYSVGVHRWGSDRSGDPRWHQPSGL